MALCRFDVVPVSATQVLINAGQANAATGDKGYEACVASAAAVAEAMGMPRDAVLIESTGVIGRQIKWASLPLTELNSDSVY